MRYYFLNLILAPGVVLHELAHVFFCWLGQARIHRIKLFQFRDPPGYVDHELPNKMYQSVLVAFGPLLLNSLATMALAAAIRPPYATWQNAVYLWLALAFGLHAIPSCGDAQALWQSAKFRFWKNPLTIIFWPFIIILYVLNFLRRWHLHFIYAAALLWIGQVYLKA